MPDPVQSPTRAWARIHVNSGVRVKLNAAGLAEYAKQGARLAISTEPTLDGEGYYRTSLGSLMRDFGHLIQLGREPPWEGEVLVETLPG
jgi:hypothetical protein